VTEKAQSFGIRFALRTGNYPEKRGPDMPPYLLNEFHQDNKNGGKEEMKNMIERHIASGRIDRLLVFCDCCLYKIFDENLLVSECAHCRIHHAKTKIAAARPQYTGPVGNT
jgi:hypothetical protein